MISRAPRPAFSPFLASTSILVALATACSGSETGTNGKPTPGPELDPRTDFESANPSGTENGRGAQPPEAAGTGGSASGPVNSGDDLDGGGSEGERTISEADIIKIEDGRLYALSRYGGLSVIDVSERDQLTVLGDHKIVAQPFEMYVEGGFVIALYNGFADYTYDATNRTWTYYQTSYVIALDAREPDAISEIARFPIGGEIADSRQIGEILYVAAYENGYCWGCSTTPRTNVISLDASTLSDIRKVDELSFEEREEYSWKRSMMATDQRLYIAGPEWGETEPVGSTIQVIDVSDPSGDMVAGAAVELAGQIDSRWQMDEFEGNLRVISQPFTWRVDRAPEIQTFRVESSSVITPLGRTLMTLPVPERLQSVRFDGNRAYAITFQQTDPLFTIDLSDPTNPRQVGELVMPGWVYHMEPRGDRVLGLGFDQGNEEGSITVSLFDVSDLAAPTMLSRVNFGGDWGSLAEDQDRIHKAFNVLDSEGLILVPFSGWSYDDDAGTCYWGEYLSGVQLVDWADDALALRGVAPSVGQARRGFLHDGRLLTMSDERVESFDIGDRDAPQKTAALPIARYVTHTAATAGNNVLRVSQNWWSDVTELDVTSVDGVGKPISIGSLELPELDNQGACYSSSWLGEVYSSDSHAYLVYDSYSYDPETSTGSQSARVLSIDLSDPTAPTVAGNVELGLQSSYYYGYYGYGLTPSGSHIVNLDSTLVISHRSVEWGSSAPKLTPGTLEIVDLSNPEAPVVTSVALPESIGFTGLLRSGSVVATSHFEPSPTNADRVRFFIDRVDISDAQAPVALPAVGIPGSLVAYDAASSHAITADYHEVYVPGVTARACYEQYGTARFQPPTSGTYDYETTPGVCVVIQQSLLLVRVFEDSAAVVDSIELELGEHVATTALGDDRLFVSVGRPYYYYYYGLTDVGYGYYSTFQERTLPLIVLSGIRSGNFTSARLELDAGDNWGYTPLVASGKRAVLSTGFRGKLVVVNAQNAAAPSLVRELDLAGYVEDLDVVGDSAIASLGYDGAQAIAIHD